MRDKYLIVRLYYEKANGSKFEFENVEFGIKPSFRQIRTMNEIDIPDIGVHVNTRKGISRESILDLEQKIMNHDDSMVGDNSLCPLKHSFSDGIYVREIFIPAGALLTGKIHKHSHPNTLLKGEVIVITEDGEEHLKGPLSIISKAGTKRALYAITDLVWITYHVNVTNTENLDQIEEFVIAPSYKEYDKFRLKQTNLFRQLKNKFIKMLS